MDCIVAEVVVDEGELEVTDSDTCWGVVEVEVEHCTGIEVDIETEVGTDIEIEGEALCRVVEAAAGCMCIVVAVEEDNTVAAVIVVTGFQVEDYVVR